MSLHQPKREFPLDAVVVVCSDCSREFEQKFEGQESCGRLGCIEQGYAKRKRPSQASVSQFNPYPRWASVQKGKK
jgi:hypothetical protein